MWWTLSRAALAATCSEYGEPTSLGAVDNPPIAEASGLAASRTRDGVFFTHGDNGDPPVIVAFDREGRLLDEHLVADASNEDWEDIAAAPCPDDGDCLYVGDIGDNDGERATIEIYVVREPKEGDPKTSSIERWVAVYPDGPHDAETLMVHPCTGDLYVVTKEDGRATVFKMPVAPEDTATLEKVAEVPIDGPSAESREVTGGDWDADGERVVLRTSDRLFLWTTDPDDPDAHWADAPMVLVGTTEVQGEGVAFGLDGDLYTTGEAVPVPLTNYACEGFARGDGACAFPQTGRTCGCAQGVGPMGLLGVLLALTAVRAAPRGPRAGRG